MKQKVFIVIIFSLLIQFGCSEGPIKQSEEFSIRITEPEDNFTLKEYDSIFINIITENEIDLDRIELYAESRVLWSNASGTLIASFNKKPYEIFLHCPEMCIEIDTLTLFAKVIYSSQREIYSNEVIGYAVIDIPPDEQLTKYEYKGYSLDSTLVTQGTFTVYEIPLGTRSYSFIGRKNITAMVSDSGYEAGEGFIKGWEFGENEHYYNLTYCAPIIGINGLAIYGFINDGVFSGDRRIRLRHDPVEIKVGTFVATKRTYD